MERNVLVASAAPRALISTRELDGSESVGKSVVDGPGALISAHVCHPAVLTSVFRGHVRQRVVGLVAALDGCVDRRFARPAAGAFAAIPVPRRFSAAALGDCRPGR